jgi:hypothetical protein
MHDGPGAVGVEHPRKVIFIAEVAALERSPFDCPLVTVLEVIERHRKVAGM